MKYAIDCFQICMALRHRMIAGVGMSMRPRARYDMSHTRGFLFGFVMDGAIVTGEACAVGCLRRKSAGGLQMASRAIFFENGVRAQRGGRGL